MLINMCVCVCVCVCVSVCLSVCVPMLMLFHFIKTSLFSAFSLHSQITVQYIHHYHVSIQLQAHEALRIMDFIKAYTDLLVRTEHKELAGKAFSDGLNNVGDQDSYSNDGDIITFLTRAYVKKAVPDLERMVHSIAQFVIKQPEESVRENEEGIFSTTAPVDLVNMINQYLDIVGRSGVEALQARANGP